jgi:hypothetical protein
LALVSKTRRLEIIPVRLLQDPKTGRFLKGNCGGKGRPPPERTKAAIKRQQRIVAAWAAGGERLVLEMYAAINGPKCAECGKPLVYTGWRTPPVLFGQVPFGVSQGAPASVPAKGD